MSLFIYTRHTQGCPDKDDRFWKRCRCPKWIRGVLNGRPIRQTAKTRSWEKAEQVRRRLEAAVDSGLRNDAMPERGKQPITIQDAVTRFLTSKKNENLAESTLQKLDTIFRSQFLPWTKSSGLLYITEIQTVHLEQLRDTWKGGALAKKKKQERVVGFFYFCVRMRWIQENPAVLLGRIKAEDRPTDYFPKSEFDRIIDATYVYNPRAWNTEPRNQATRVRTLILLMRWSGLAIGDAVGLERSRLNKKDELLLYRAKTGHPVYVPLPAHVADALRALPPGALAPNPRYFFWSGNGKLKSAISDWQRSLRRVFELADLKLEDGSKKRCHPHMFRDTFAVENLLAGVPLEQVSILLGHKSVKITEKHYAPWGKARQELLTANVRKAWGPPAVVTPIRKAAQDKEREGSLG